jgi:hydrogenase maturation factor HypF (carbamoyltransferase family)
MTENMVCQNIRVSGVVQGVGFRPFVWRLASELGLGGWVRNDSRGVEIEVCGAAEQVQSLITRLEREAPPLARISAVVARDAAPAVHDGRDFVIIDSRSGRAGTMIGHDTAVCRDCLAEMFEPSNRRWRYAFSNCTNCGPRYTISRGLPYDRVRTSLKPLSCARSASTSTASPRIGVFTPRPIAVRSVVRSCAWSMPRDTAAGRPARRDAGPAARRENCRHQGPGRLSSGLRCPQCGRRRAPARAQAA